jgi:hypothetical protein
MGRQSHTSSVLILRHPTAHPVTSPCLPLVASLALSVGDLAMVPPGFTAVGGVHVRIPGIGRAYVGGAGGTGTGDARC